MNEVQCHYETPLASRYLQQMCKHFSHKVPAEWTEMSGSVTFPIGSCVMEAKNGVLSLVCKATEGNALPMLVKLVEVHLERFAYRNPPTLLWLEDGRPADELMGQLRAMPDPHKAGEPDDHHD